MIYARFLWSIANALQQKVHGSVASPEARNVLKACVRAIAGLANSLEGTPPADLLDAASLPAELRAALASPDPLASAWPPDAPPENPAAHGGAAGPIAACARWLEQADWQHDRQLHATARSLIAWEKSLLDAAVDRMVEVGQRTAGQDDSARQLRIDPVAVEGYFQRSVNKTAKVSEFRQVVGGRSRQTALFTLEGDTGLPRKLVIQRDHPAGITPQGAREEFPVLQAAHRAGMKVPKPLLVEPSRDFIGAPFMVSEQVPGSILGPDYFQPPRSAKMALGLAEQLAILHRIPFDDLAANLRHTLKVNDASGWRQELDAIRETWHRLTHWPCISVSAALAWMEANIDSVENHLSIVHNDTAFHNILGDAEEIAAVLDWELVHIGHPAEDLGYCRPFVEEMTSWDKFMAAYVAAGGEPMSQRQIDYFSLRANVHLTTLLQYGRSMFEGGKTSDINLAEAATSFMPKLMRRLGTILESVLKNA